MFAMGIVWILLSFCVRILHIIAYNLFLTDSEIDWTSFQLSYCNLFILLTFYFFAEFMEQKNSFLLCIQFLDLSFLTSFMLELYSTMPFKVS